MHHDYEEREYYRDKFRFLTGIWNRTNFMFQRGALSILEISGTYLFFRSAFLGDLNINGAGLGALMLIVGLIFEFLIWRQTVDIIRPRMDALETENAFLKLERDRLLNAMLSGAPTGAFSERNKPPSKSDY